MSAGEIDFSRLLGFVGNEFVQGSFKDEGFGSRAGAKVGAEPGVTEAGILASFKNEAFANRAGAKVGEAQH